MNPEWTSLPIIVGLIVGLSLIARLGHRLSRRTVEDYFTASRALGTFVSLFTYTASLCSAFTFLGCAGWGYSRGLAWYGPIGFGTAAVALNFLVFGYPVWKLGKRHGYVSPPELLRDRFGPPIQILYALVMLVCVLPYIAVQVIGAGYVLEEISGGVIPYLAGSGLVAVFMLILTVGGMRSVAWTDAVLGIFMLVALAAAFGVVSHHLGGLRAATEQVSRQYPALLTIRGAQDYFSPGIWLGFVVLWVVADPLMPHLWTRMYVARSPRVLTRMALLFPLVCLVVFFFPVWIGVLGRPVIPGLVGPETDRILPLLMTELAPSWLAAVVLSGALAALVSTADSQALALSSILTRDVYKTYLRPRASNRQQLRVARLMLAVLFVFGFLIAVRPVSTLVAITTVAFTGIGVLYPATMAALYWRRATTPAVLASVVSGEVISVLLTWHLLPSWLTLGSLPIIPGLLTATGVLVLVSYLTTPSVESHRP